MRRRCRLGRYVRGAGSARDLRARTLSEWRGSGAVGRDPARLSAGGSLHGRARQLLIGDGVDLSGDDADGAGLAEDALGLFVRRETGRDVGVRDPLAALFAEPEFHPPILASWLEESKTKRAAAPPRLLSRTSMRGQYPFLKFMYIDKSHSTVYY